MYFNRDTIADEAGDLKRGDRLVAGLKGVLRGYAAVVFGDQVVVGLVILLGTMIYPNIGLAGLIGAVTGGLVASVFRFRQIDSGFYVYNSLLVGLSLGAYYSVDIYLLFFIVLSAAFTVFLTAALLDALWRFGNLPVLSLPFVVAALTVALAAKGYGMLQFYSVVSVLEGGWFGTWLDSFFSALGAIFFSAHPVMGFILFICILARSRYLAFLTFFGYLSGYLVLSFLKGEFYTSLLAWTGFNFALTAMALGGIFMVPGIASFILAMLGAALAAVLSSAFGSFLLVYNLPVMALPFLLATLTLLAALRMRGEAVQPRLLLTHPGLPEANYERARLSRARLGDADSVGILPPFFGEWEIYQGIDGRYTHKDAWRHALDFFITREGRSFQGDGTASEDYYCFGLPVVSPVHGVVVRVRQDIPDNPPGEVSTEFNWGNFVLIAIASGQHVLIAHLQQGSISVKEGEVLTPGSVIGKCGSSGRSPQPHLHMQVQRDSRLGSGTVPFHLSNVVVKDAGEPARFSLVARPTAGQRLQRARQDGDTFGQLHFPVGKTLDFKFRETGKEPRECRLRVDLTLLGQFRLVTQSGASAAFEEVSGVLAFFDRQGPKDPFLDLWMLAMGLTPLTDKAETWHDEPSAALFPLSRSRRIWMSLLHPLGCGIRSDYRRKQNEDTAHWVQSGRHQCPLGGVMYSLETEALVTPESGVTRLTLKLDGQTMEAELIKTGRVGDRGIPALEQELRTRGR